MKALFIKICALVFSILLLTSLFACSDAPERYEPSTPEVSEAIPSEPNGSEQVIPAPPLTPEIIEVESIVVLLDADSYARGANVTPEVIILPEDATNKTFSIESSDSSVLRRRSGRWSAVGAGTAELIVTAANGVTGSATVIVYVAVESISLQWTELTIHNGDSADISFSLMPEDSTENNVVFVVADEEIVAVSEAGTLTAIATGTTSISVIAGEVEETITVNVIEPIRSVTVTADRRAYLVGDEGSFSIRLTPDGATDAELEISISGDEISLTGERTFDVLTPGEVTITVTAANGVHGSFTLSVIDIEAFAEEVLRLTNVERERANLPAFISTEQLTQAAMVRAEEITEYFSHTRPDGTDCFTAFRENDVEYVTAGENLAAGHRTPADVVRGWMNSPSHRGNIINPSFGRMGVGLAMNEDGRLYWTQAFTD